MNNKKSLSGEVSAPAEPERLFSVNEAAKVLNLKYSQARAWLGDPDKIDWTATGHLHLLYTETHVMEVKRKREEHLQRRAENLGKRSCYHCRTFHDEKDLISGLCLNCYTRKMVKNFIHHGDCCKYPKDAKRLKALINVIKDFLPRKSA